MAFDRSKALKAAQKHLTKGNLDKAIGEYERLVAEDPSDARVLLKLGDLYTRKGDAKKACSVYRRVADQYSEQGFFLKAVAVFKQILKLDSSQLEAWEKLAEMYELLSLTSDALATYEQVADAYAHAGNTVRALDAMGKMAQLDPDNVAAAVKYAEALAKVHRKEEAAEAFMQGARVLKRQGRMVDYVKVTERLLFHQPGNLGVAKELAGLYLGQRDAKRALAKLQICFKADPRDLDTLGMLASSFDLLAQAEKAASVYREMLRILAEAGDPGGQVHVLRQLLRLDPQDVEARRRLTDLGEFGDDGPTEESVPIIDLSDTELDDDDDIILVDEDSGVMPLGIEDSQSGARNLPASEAPEDIAAQIERMMSECEVFNRYQLYDKMEAQLKGVLSLAPDHLEARLKLAEHYANTQMPRKAAAEFLRAARSTGVDWTSAQRYLTTAAELDPGNTAVAQALLEDRPTSQVRHVEGVDIPEYNRGGEPDALVILDDEGSGAALAPAKPVAGHTPAGDLVFDSNIAMDSDAPPLTANSGSQAASQGGATEALPDDFIVADSQALPPDDDVEPFSEDLVIEESDVPPALDEPELFSEDLVIEETALDPPSALAATGSSSAQTGHARADETEPELIFDEPLMPEDPEAAFFSDSRGLDGEPEMVIAEATEEDARLIAEVESEAVARESLPPPAVSLPPDVAEALEEADFYQQQGLDDEAVESLQDALDGNPGHPALIAKLAILQPEAGHEDLSPEEDDEDDQSFALAEKLASESSGSPNPGKNDDLAVADVIEQFRAGVEKAVDREDTATHYDLGIAYVEMGLHQEAIAEFTLCLQDADRRCQAHTMIGLSFLAEGTMDQAIEHFKDALRFDPNDGERLELWFELGNVYELLDKTTEALVYYDNVRDIDPEFRDVATRIERLRTPAAPGKEDDEFDDMFDNMILKD